LTLDKRVGGPRTRNVRAAGDEIRRSWATALCKNLQDDLPRRGSNDVDRQ
jgi:hypothetical protein